MSLINKLVSLYILLNYLTYMMSAIVSNHFIINNISQAIKVDIIYDNRETTDKVSSLLPTTGTAEISERQWYGQQNVPNGAVISPEIRKKTLKDFMKSLDSSNNVNNETAETLAKNHFHRVVEQIVCKIPKPVVIKVKDIYSDVHKIFYPTCTILHRCSEHTGCCYDATKKCTTFKTQNVTLYFMVQHLTKEQKLKTTTYEPLSFVNDTLCRCLTTAETMPRDIESTNSQLTVSPVVRHSHRFSRSPFAKLRHRCKCPGPYAVHYGEDGICTCNCNEIDCISYARGDMYFNYTDRYCITTGNCVIPSCLYGTYNKKFGRCPTKHETYYFSDDNL